jgi:bisphosphoglycerate-dependent phosphoglycerate mutase
MNVWEKSVLMYVLIQMNELKKQKKFTLLLAHDSTLMALLAALKQLDDGATSKYNPPYYASSLVFELRKKVIIHHMRVTFPPVATVAGTKQH